MPFRNEVSRSAHSPCDLEDLIHAEDADVIEIRFACSDALFRDFLGLSLKYGVGFRLAPEFRDESVPDTVSPIYRRAIQILEADRSKTWAACLALARSQ
jgi:hypothetical protein